VVFPDADVKVFLTASAEERARRRHDERQARGESVEAAEVHADMVARDAADSTRATAPLQAADDATRIDTTGMSILEVVGILAALVTATTGVPELTRDGEMS
ncbi:MAG: (d)CMP kinase, partial [Coriobacteriia bacterium]|nr:(d)CMP kinase [Coriobacteriia bacterium]